MLNKLRYKTMIRTQIYITEDQHKELKKIYAETGQRITESIRQAVADYLRNKKMHKVPRRKKG